MWDLNKSNSFTTIIFHFYAEYDEHKLFKSYSYVISIISGEVFRQKRRGGKQMVENMNAPYDLSLNS